jgi:hypothetical protein
MDGVLGRLFSVLSALSLLLCVAVVALWVRSVEVHEQVSGARRGGRLWWVESQRGRVEVVVVERRMLWTHCVRRRAPAPLGGALS